MAMKQMSSRSDESTSHSHRVSPTSSMQATSPGSQHSGKGSSSRKKTTGSSSRMVQSERAFRSIDSPPISIDMEIGVFGEEALRDPPAAPAATPDSGVVPRKKVRRSTTRRSPMRTHGAPHTVEMMSRSLSAGALSGDSPSSKDKPPLAPGSLRSLANLHSSDHTTSSANRANSKWDFPTSQSERAMRTTFSPPTPNSVNQTPRTLKSPLSNKAKNLVSPPATRSPWLPQAPTLGAIPATAHAHAARGGGSSSNVASVFASPLTAQQRVMLAKLKTKVASNSDHGMYSQTSLVSAYASTMQSPVTGRALSRSDHLAPQPPPHHVASPPGNMFAKVLSSPAPVGPPPKGMLAPLPKNTRSTSNPPLGPPPMGKFAPLPKAKRSVSNTDAPKVPTRCPDQETASPSMRSFQSAPIFDKNLVLKTPQRKASLEKAGEKNQRWSLGSSHSSSQLPAVVHRRKSVEMPMGIDLSPMKPGRPGRPAAKKVHSSSALHNDLKLTAKIPTSNSGGALGTFRWESSGNLNASTGGSSSRRNRSANHTFELDDRDINLNATTGGINKRRTRAMRTNPPVVDIEFDINLNATTGGIGSRRCRPLSSSSPVDDDQFAAMNELLLGQHNYSFGGMTSSRHNSTPVLVGAPSSFSGSCSRWESSSTKQNSRWESGGNLSVPETRVPDFVSTQNSRWGTSGRMSSLGPEFDEASYPVDDEVPVSPDVLALSILSQCR